MAKFHYGKSHTFSDIKYVNYSNTLAGSLHRIKKKKNLQIKIHQKLLYSINSNLGGGDLVTEIISPLQMPIILFHSKELMICHIETLQHHLSPAKHHGINVIPLLFNFYGGGGDINTENYSM